MRLAIGLLLIGLALFGGYMILSGKFPPTQANSSVNGSAEPIGAIGSAAMTGQATGSGGASVIGRLTHLGVPAYLSGTDMHASRGGFSHVS